MIIIFGLIISFFGYFKSQNKKSLNVNLSDILLQSNKLSKYMINIIDSYIDYRDKIQMKNKDKCMKELIDQTQCLSESLNREDVYNFTKITRIRHYIFHQNEWTIGYYRKGRNI